MKENTIIVLGLGAIVYYLWNKGNKESMVIHHTKPMIIAENGEAPSWVRDAPEGTPVSLPSDVTTNPLNLPNLGIPWKDRPDMTYSNIGGGHKTKGGKNCTVEYSTNNTSYKCKGKFDASGNCQPCSQNVVNHATDPNWEAQSVFSRLR